MGVRNNYPDVSITMYKIFSASFFFTFVLILLYPSFSAAMALSGYPSRYYFGQGAKILTQIKPISTKKLRFWTFGSHFSHIFFLCIVFFVPRNKLLSPATRHFSKKMPVHRAVKNLNCRVEFIFM